jgi:putative ABC transport system permease protein
VLDQYFSDPLALGAAQAAVAMALALAVVLLARQQGIRLVSETVVALARGLAQVIAVGALLLLVLRGPLWASVLVLLAMVLFAAVLAVKRAGKIPGAFQVSLVGIGAGAGLVIGSMTLLGVIEPEPSALVPVGSMIIANAMKTAALALDRFRGELDAHTGQIEAALALGAEPGKAVERFVQASVQASLIPSIDSLRSLGIVWIPGLMAGMILSGEDPVYAAIYQFVVIAMIFAAGGVASVVSTLLIRRRVFTPAQQLALRTG